MRVLPAILIYLALVGDVQAQTVQVRSGEHEAYSRLTMALPSRIPFQLEPGDRGVRILFENSGFTLDTSQIFARIPRDRLFDAEWDAKSRALELKFQCACEAKAFWHDRSMLVVDISNRRPDPESKLERPARPKAKTSVASDIAPWPLDRERQSRAVDLMIGDMARMPPSADTTVAEPSLSDEARERLLQQVGRAASQGLLSPRLEHPQSTTQTAEKPTDKPSDPITRPIPEPSSQDHINLKAQSSIDRDFLVSLEARHQSLAGAGCLANERIDVSSWGDERPFGAQISVLRLKLTGEFDAPDPDIAKKLAQLYLFFGFGVEARALLGFLPEDDPDLPILQDLSDISEDGYAMPGSILAGQMDCQSPGALWSALSYEELPTDRPIDPDAILRAFNALPSHLRALYGPILSKRFLRAGEVDVATKLMRILERNENTLTPQFGLVTAELHAAKGEKEAADTSLEAVVESNSEPSVEALVRLIDERFAAGEMISYEQAQLAGAYAYERQNHADGGIVAAAHIRALAASGALTEAFSEYEAAHSRLAPALSDELQSDLMLKLSEQPDDILFLQRAMPLDPVRLSNLKIEVSNALAHRLLGLGFADQASQMLEPDAPPNHRGVRERQLLRAETALAMGYPRMAIVELLDLTGEDANLLRAQAYSMAGEHKAAQYLFAGADRQVDARREAFLDANWEAAAAYGDPVYADLAAVMRTADAQAQSRLDESQTVLARNRDLVDDSAGIRATLSNLLAATPRPDPLPE